MKLYRSYITILFVVLFAGILACSNENSEITPELTVSLENMTVSSSENTKTFYINSNIDWTIDISETWCSVSPQSGSSGNTTVVVSLEENNLFEERSVVIGIQGGELNRQVQVQQEKAYLLTVASNEIDISNEGGEVSVHLQTSEAFEVLINCDWITKKTLKTLKDSSEVYVVEANTTYIPREGEITYTLNDISEVITVNQEGNNPSIPEDITGVESDAETLAAKMIVGWNVGNSLEVPGGETLWGNPKINQDLIDGVKDAGFNAIRIPCAWDSYIIDEETYQISEEWLTRVKEVVDYCYNSDLYAIINIHWDGGWLEEHPLYSYQDEVNKKQYALWIQIATFFRDYDEHLLFAGTNEVRENYNTPTTENIEVQESYVQTFVDAVRATGGKNAYRNLVVQTYNTNIDHGINLNTMPTDAVENRLILEVHYYDPYEFTIKTDDGYNTQWGQDYTDVSDWGQEDYLEAQFQKLKTKYIDNDIPVIIGEYSAMLRGDMSTEAQAKHEESRNYYHAKINEVAESMGITTFYWDNGYTTKNASGLFNRSTGEPVHSSAIEAIINVYK